MKGVVQEAYGPPEVLRIRDVEAPATAEGEVLVRVGASAVTPTDCAFRAGRPFIVRFFTGLRRPRSVPGSILAGRVEQVGRGVTRFAVGDRVFGGGTGAGGRAELASVPADGVVAPIPAGMSDEEAVSLCDLGLTALLYLRDGANLRSGQRILVNGASGSIGAGAIQLAGHLGAHVTGVCSTRNVELVESLGADAVIDYTRNDFTTADERYDAILDAVGMSSFARCARCLRPGGIYLTTTPSPTIFAQTLWTSRFGSRRAKILLTGLAMTGTDLAQLVDLYEAGALKPVIDRTYALEQVADAHRYVETRRKRGTVIVTS